MSRRSGGFRGAKPTWTTTSTSGIFGMEDVVELKAAGQWPRGPVAPTSLAGTPGDGQVALTWTAPATTHGTITDYVVEYTPAAGTPTVVATGSTAASYTLTGLTNGTEYTIRVAGVNHTRGDWSGSVTGTPSAAAPPAQVTGLAVDSTGDGTIDLSWTAPASDANITDYSVEYTPSGGSATTVLVGSAATSYQITGLTNDTEYSVRVAAVSAAGTGAYSVAVTGTPGTPGTQQFYPNGFTVSGFTGGYAVYNGDYSHPFFQAYPGTPPTQDPGSLMSDSTGGRDYFQWNGIVWKFSGSETGYEIDYVNSTGGGDRDNFPLSGWSTPGGTLTFTAR